MHAREDNFIVEPERLTSVVGALLRPRLTIDMAEIPVICDSCGRLWFSRRVFGGAGRLTSVGGGVGLCPTCGGSGHIPDGRSAIAPGVTRVLASDLTGDDLRKLLNLLLEAQSTGPGAEETAATIVRDVPQAAPLAALL